MIDSRFFQQARLVLRCLPAVNTETCFALKGGTAINFFLRDMPRLSVDIDLTYLPVEPRTESLQKIEAALKRIVHSIQKTVPGTRVQEIKERNTQRTIKLLVSQNNILIKIEPNTILRGTVFPPVSRPLCKKAVDLFGLSISTKTLSEEDLYGGKICAALDRQHPRDLFDVIDIAKGALDERTRQAFLVYLISHDRAISDLLALEKKNIHEIFENEFKGMMETDVPLDELIEARANLFRSVHASLTAQDKEFLLSLKSGEPDWSLFPIADARNLPAVQWKLVNIRKMTKEKRDRFIKKLKKALGP